MFYAAQKVINAALDAFVGALQTKETDKGVALFSQNLFALQKSGPKPTLEQIQRFVDKMPQVSKNVIPVSIVAGPSDVPRLKVPAGVKPSGALFDRHIYLGSRGDVLRSRLHGSFQRFLGSD